MVGWIDGWLVRWLVGWLVALLLGWLVGGRFGLSEAGYYLRRGSPAPVFGQPPGAVQASIAVPITEDETRAQGAQLTHQLVAETKPQVWGAARGADGSSHSCPASAWPQLSPMSLEQSRHQLGPGEKDEMFRPCLASACSCYLVAFPALSRAEITALPPSRQGHRFGVLAINSIMQSNPPAQLQSWGNSPWGWSGRLPAVL